MIRLTRPYYHLFHQEQPGVFHQMRHKGLTSVTIRSCSNCWSTLILANKCTWWQVYSAFVYLMVYHISKVCPALMYMQHMHMVYGELQIYHYLVLDQNLNDNAYSTPLRHEVWNMDHKKVMLGIYLCYNSFSHLGVQHQHYPEHDTVCLSILFQQILCFICLDQWHHFFFMFFFQKVLKFLR